jgi:hypothetical protein
MSMQDGKKKPRLHQGLELGKESGPLYAEWGITTFSFRATAR